MRELQEFTRDFQNRMNWQIKTDDYETTRASLLNNYMLLTTEVAEIAEELRGIFNKTHQYIKEGIREEEAFQIAQDSVKNELGKEFADCLAYIFKFANFFEVDLEGSFYEKMDEVANRKNKDVSYVKK